MVPQLNLYIELIEALTARRISATKFESRYLDLFKNDATEWSEEEFLILDGLFACVDAFCADPELREADDLDEEQLQSAAKVALERLRQRAGSRDARV